jgi:OOP family OmpA-OmpF porin
MLHNNSTLLNFRHKIFAGTLVLLFSLFSSVGSFAQADKRLLTEAQKYFDFGDYYTAARLYEQYLNPDPSLKTKKGLPVYNSLRSRGKSSKNNLTKTDVVYKLATTYRLSYYFPQAAEKYKECYTTAANQYPDSYYWYAVCMRSVGNFSEARTALDKFLASYAAGSPLKAAAEAEKQTLDFIDQQLKRPDTILYVVRKADNVIGMEKGVYAPAYAGQAKIFVTSTVKDTTVKKNQNPYRNRLFTAIEASDYTIQGLEALQVQENDNTANQGTAVLHPKGEILYFTQWSKLKDKTTSSIYISRKKDGKWLKAEKLANINADGFNTKQPSLSGDATTLYFASDRTGTLGGFDIWSVSLDAGGLPAAEPVNLGSDINTPGNEQAPYYHPAEKILIFSTDNRPGMGGYDFYMSKGSGVEWTNAQNLGYPVNSTRDDIYYYNAGAEFMKHAYFSSDRGSNCCLETYHLEKLPKKRRLSGLLLSNANSEPIADAEVELVGVPGGKIRTDAEGRFTVELKDNENPSDLIFTKDSFISKTTQFKLHELNDKDPLTNVYVNETVYLDKVGVIKPENISPVYFDFNKYELRKEGKIALDSVYDILYHNPTYTVKVDAHTDSKGTDKYNLKLSKRRANSVVNYLLRKGVEPSRITLEAFGKAVPVVDDMPNGVYDPQAAQLNRRALVHITKPE